MNKAFLSNLSLLLLINILIKPFYLFGIDAQVQNQLGANNYGMYFAIFNFAFLFQFVLDPGILNYNSTYLSKDRSQLNKLFPQTFVTKLIMANVFTFIVILCGFMFYPKSEFKYLVLIIIIQILTSFYLYFRSHFSALGHYRKDVYFSALDKILMIASIGYLILNKQISIFSFLSAQALSLIFANLFVIFFIKNLVPFKIHLSLEAVKETLLRSMPFGLVFLLMTLYTRMDAVMLEYFLDDNAYQAGVYAASYRLLDAVNIVGILMASLLLPMFANIITKQKELYELSQISVRIVLFIATATVLTAWFYNREILELIYINLEQDYFDTFKILMISFLAFSISYVYGTLITASGKLKWFNIFFIIGIIINWLLNWILIPISGAVGAATATVITQTAVMLGQTVLAHYQFKLQINYMAIVQFIVLLFSCFFIFEWLSQLFEYQWWLRLGLSLILFFFVSILIQFVRLKWVFGMAFED